MNNMKFTCLESNIIRFHHSIKFIRKIIGKKHSLKSISDKKYNLKKKYESSNAK